MAALSEARRTRGLHLGLAGTVVTTLLAIAACDDPPRPPEKPVAGSTGPASAPVAASASGLATASVAPSASAGASGTPSASAASSASAAAEEDAAPAAVADAAPSSSGAKKKPDLDRIRVLDPGKEPRKVFRYSFAQGDRERVELTMDTKIRLSVAGMPAQDPAAPRMYLTVAYEVVDLRGDTALREMTIEDVRYDAAVLDARTRKELDRSIGGLRGVKAQDRVDRRGNLQGLNVVGEAAKNPQLKAMLQQLQRGLSSMGVPLPKEPIGAGARWESRALVKQAGVSAAQRTEYQLETAPDPTGSVTVTISQKAGKQKVKSPMPGLSTTLLSMKATGGGKLSFDLAHLLPVGSLETSQAQKVQAVFRGQTRMTESTMSVRIRFKRLDPRGAPASSGAPRAATSSAPAPAASQP